jgi:hypothetical protein
MSSKHLRAIVGFGFAAAAGAACGSAGQTVRTEDAVQSPEGVELSWQEREGLTFTREEEKLARDVYAMLEVHDHSFANIGRSEQTHMDAVAELLARYELPDPAAGRALGDFANSDLQVLYEALVDQGGASRMAALAVGVEIEELDIHDIDQLAAEATHPDILGVYEHLTRGSRNHLRTFYGKLVAAGGDYTPKYLDRQRFDAIIAAPMERGP